jgi:hypothetical protein
MTENTSKKNSEVVAAPEKSAANTKLEQKSWPFIYLVLGIVLSIEGTIIPMTFKQFLTFATVSFVTIVVFLYNEPLQNWIARLRRFKSVTH